MCCWKSPWPSLWPIATPSSRPQQAPDVIRRSELADKAGWFETDPATLQHPRYPEIFAAGELIGQSFDARLSSNDKGVPDSLRMRS